MIEVTVAQESDKERWQRFAAARTNHHAYSFHWRTILERVFGHRPHYLLAVEGGEVCGILPLVLLRSVLFGRALISLPYLNAGGIVGATDAATNALLERANTLGTELGVDYLELRHAGPIETYGSRMPVRTHKVSMELALDGGHEAVFGRFPPKLRSQVRRPSKSGVIAQVSGDDLGEIESIQAFYAVFSEHMRDLGTPVYPRRLFQQVKACFGKACRIITVWHDGKPVAAGITVGHGPKAEIAWASALKSHNRLSPNMILYWTAMKTACQDGYATFDFGRSSPESGTYRFKEQWGATPLPLHWYYQMFRGEVPDVNPNNPKYTALVSCWRRLPLPVANLIGPWLTRSLP